jgi:hypothetical protein
MTVRHAAILLSGLVSGLGWVSPASADDGQHPPIGGQEIFERALAKGPPEPVRRTPIVLGGVGLSTLMGVDASAIAFSGEVEVGILRYLSAQARIDLPLGTQRLSLTSGSDIRVAPTFAGGGVSFPLSTPSSFMIPRLGGGAGAAWIRAERRPSQGFDSQGELTATSLAGTDSVASFAIFGSAALSMRVAGPFRLMVDGVFGTTTSRLVVRDHGTDAAYWGVPFLSLALRMELQIE